MLREEFEWSSSLLLGTSTTAPAEAVQPRKMLTLLLPTDCQQMGQTGPWECSALHLLRTALV